MDKQIRDLKKKITLSTNKLEKNNLAIEKMKAENSEIEKDLSILNKLVKKYEELQQEIDEKLSLWYNVHF